MQSLARQGHEAWQIFVVQRADAHLFRPAVHVDPAYTRELRQAFDRGVKVAVFQEMINLPEITLAETLPFDLILPADT